MVARASWLVVVVAVLAWGLVTSPAMSAVSPPTLTIDDVSVAEGDSGRTPAVFTVRLSAASKKQVSVDFLTAAGSATNDFAAASGTLVFAKGQTARQVTVRVIGDTSVEPDETFVLRLRNARHAVIADAVGQGTIRDDDAPPPPPTRTLTVSKAGTGTGRVTSTGIDCGSDCSEGYPNATSVTLTPTADSGSTFAGWSGACTGTGTGTCTLTMNADTTATATFNVTPPPTPATPNVFLGYADTYFGGLPFIPSPWQGDPGVVFLGCTRLAEGCSEYNAGAIRIDNPASNPALTLTDAYVDIEECRFRPWDALLLSPAIAGPGETFVLTQSGVFGPPQPAPCDASMPVEWRPLTNFATVTGPFDTASPPSYNCDPSDSVVSPPTVTLVFADGMRLTVLDNPDPTVQNDEVLNTGGVHIVACSVVSPGQPWSAVPAANITRTP